jgi:hypothetical protein
MKKKNLFIFQISFFALCFVFLSVSKVDADCCMNNSVNDYNRAIINIYWSSTANNGQGGCVGNLTTDGTTDGVALDYLVSAPGAYLCGNNVCRNDSCVSSEELAPSNENCGYQGQPCCDNYSCKQENLACRYSSSDGNLYIYTCQDVGKPSEATTFIEPLKPKTCLVGFRVSDSALERTPLERIKDDGIQTAIGCIPTSFEGFVRLFFNWGIGLAGGIAFILMLFASFSLLTSGGNPEKVKAAQERLTSAIIGLLFIIFSVFLLRIIGLPIMQLGS